jgi:hypothetical protein
MEKTIASAVILIIAAFVAGYVVAVTRGRRRS